MIKIGPVVIDKIAICHLSNSGDLKTKKLTKCFQNNSEQSSNQSDKTVQAEKSNNIHFSGTESPTYFNFYEDNISPTHFFVEEIRFVCHET